MAEDIDLFPYVLPAFLSNASAPDVPEIREESILEDSPAERSLAEDMGLFPAGLSSPLSPSVDSERKVDSNSCKTAWTLGAWLYPVSASGLSYCVALATPLVWR